MWLHNLDPTLFSLGPLEIRWYGLVYALGFLFTAWWLKKNKEKLGLKKDDNWDLVFYALIAGIAGARLFEIFWEPIYYLGNPLNILKIWQGGMSFHGGFVGGTIGIWWFCKKKNLSFAKVADLISLPFMLALAFGRIANFINGELWGRVSNSSWCVNFKNTGGGDVCRHPSTLYAAGKRFLILGWLYFLSLKNNFKPGFIIWNFVFWEGLGRIIVDFYRFEKTYYLGFTMGQLLSLLMVLVALYAFWRYYRNDWKKILGTS